MAAITVKQALQSTQTDIAVEVKGWVRTFRSNRFIALNDGSTINNIQAVIDFENLDEVLLKQIKTGACLSIKGKLVQSQGKGQSVEIQTESLDVLGEANPEEYPLQPKKHSLECTFKNANFNIFGCI